MMIATAGFERRRRSEREGVAGCEGAAELEFEDAESVAGDKALESVADDLASLTPITKSRFSSELIMVYIIAKEE